MIAAYFGCNNDSHDIFDGLNIAKTDSYNEFLNKYHVIYIDFSKLDDECISYEEYIGNIKDILADDIRKIFGDIEFRKGSTVAEDLKRVFDETGTRFIFVLDEWDAVFHLDFISEVDRSKYLLFLKNLLKDQAYVVLAYMTGILPIAKYSSGSELNMFLEYTMASEEKYSRYFAPCKVI